MLREHSQRSPAKAMYSQPPSVTVVLRSSTSPHIRTLKLPLNGGGCLIGRASKNANKNLMPQPGNALFECAVMSRYHASIKAVGGVDGPIMIQDTKSMHGVYVNGKQIQSIEIAIGDTIKFGASVSRLDTVHDGIEVHVTDIIRKPATSRKVVDLSSEETATNSAEHMPPSGQTQSQTQGASMKCPVYIDIDADHTDADNKAHPARPSPSAPLRYEDLEDNQDLFGPESDSPDEEDDVYCSSDEEADMNSERSLSPGDSDAASDDEGIDDDNESKADAAEETLSPEQPPYQSKAVVEVTTAPAPASFSAGGFPWDNANHNTIAKAHASNQLPSIDHMTSGMDVASRPSPQFPPRNFSDMMRPSINILDNAFGRYGSGSQGPWNDRPTYSNNGVQPSIANLLGSNDHQDWDWDSNHREDATDMFDDCSNNNKLRDNLPAEDNSTANTFSTNNSSVSAILPPPTNSIRAIRMPALDPAESLTTEGQEESADKEDSVISEDAVQKDVLDAPISVTEDASTATSKRKRDAEDDGSVEVVEQEVVQPATQVGDGEVAVQTSRPIKTARRNKRVKVALSAVGTAVGGMAVLFGALMTPLSEQLLVDWEWPQTV